VISEKELKEKPSEGKSNSDLLRESLIEIMTLNKIIIGFI